MTTGSSSRRRKYVVLAGAIFLVFYLPPTLHADLHFAQPVAHVGEVRSGTSLKHAFTFVNSGTELVEVTDVRASCGCLTPRLEQRTYQPGEKGTLLLEVNTLTQAAGEHVWTVHVATQSGSETTLRLSARIVTEVSVQPASLTVFADSAVTHEITLTDLRAHPLSITNVLTTSAHLKARVTEQKQDAAGHAVRKIRLELSADHPDGRSEEAVTIYTDDPSYRDLKVPVTIHKRPRQRVTALPDAVALTALSGQGNPSKIVRIRDGQDQDVEIDRVEADDPALQCHWSQGPYNPATVKVTLDHTRIKDGEMHSAIHVYLKKPVKEILTIPVSGKQE